ncbi:hypothetical protein [Candidatus Trichorickettsia mobilis]|uniref:hypothetical protein n=1 Tax=Candidatus Trichorickettsia mobilis TaxID=1346319 RepID=UPI00292FF49F|nr:hypothetical protein [Candidatus Trichorickettsia mobilis]
MKNNEEELEKMILAIKPKENYSQRPQMVSCYQPSINDDNENNTQYYLNKIAKIKLEQPIFKEFKLATIAVEPLQSIQPLQLLNFVPIPQVDNNAENCCWELLCCLATVFAKPTEEPDLLGKEAENCCKIF